MQEVLAFFINNLEITVAILGGLSIGGFMFLKKNGTNENDLTPLYIKYKRYNERINKATKSIL